MIEIIGRPKQSQKEGSAKRLLNQFVFESRHEALINMSEIQSVRVRARDLTCIFVISVAEKCIQAGIFKNVFQITS